MIVNCVLKTIWNESFVAVTQHVLEVGKRHEMGCVMTELSDDRAV